MLPKVNKYKCIDYNRIKITIHIKHTYYIQGTIHLPNPQNKNKKGPEKLGSLQFLHVVKFN